MRPWRRSAIRPRHAEEGKRGPLRLALAGCLGLGLLSPHCQRGWSAWGYQLVCTGTRSVGV